LLVQVQHQVQQQTLTISGDYNTVNLSQKSDNNVLLFGVNGDHNDLTVSQGDNVNDTGGHRAIVDVTGNYNSTSLTQYDTGFGSGQFADINISGNDNTITSTQRETDKMLFIDVNGSDNTITTDQKDSGSTFFRYYCRFKSNCKCNTTRYRRSRCYS
jgi:hypothetical protein